MNNVYIHPNKVSFEKEREIIYKLPPRQINDFSYSRNTQSNFKNLYKKKKNIYYKKPKYLYQAKDGNVFAAGGILLYEEKPEGKGFWFLNEKDDDDYNSDEDISGDFRRNKNFQQKGIFTDFGGKYDYNDGDIFATISREFREETFNMCEIPYNVIKKLSQTNYIYVNGYNNKPSYFCIVANVNIVQGYFNSSNIEKEKEEILSSNPSVPEEWYRTLGIKFILLEDLDKYKFSRRVLAVIQNIYKDGILEKNKELKDFFDVN